MKAKKIYKGQIDDTWDEIDLTDFFKDNPKYDTRNKNQKVSNSEITEYISEDNK